MAEGLRWLTNDAHLGCPHPPGKALPQAQQSWVTIDAVPMLIGDDPVGRTIVGCPFSGVAIIPCTGTLALLPDGEERTGHSVFVRVDGQPACLETVKGFTNGTPPGTHNYDLKLSRAGQEFVGVQS